MSAAELFRRALALHQAGELAAALDLYRRLQSLLPDDATPPANAAMALAALGDRPAALALCRRAMALAPQLAPLRRLAADLAADPPAARRLFRLAWLLQPEAAETCNNFANFLTAQGDDDEAAIFYRRALLLDPHQPEIFANLAARLTAQGQAAAALRAARAAVILAPGRAESCNNLANALVERGDHDGAIRQFGRARRLTPALVEICINEGGLRLDLGDEAAGTALSRQAVALAPGRSGGYNNLANGALMAGRLTAAEACFGRALRLTPDDPQIRFNRAGVLLKLGRLREGWRDYEGRRWTPAARRRRRGDDPPDWPGGDPAGQSLLLSGEQGYGDALQFCRFAPWLAARGAQVTLRVQSPLVRLMRSLGPQVRVIAEADGAAAARFHLPLMSVPACFDLDLPDIPAATAYLAADPAEAAAWADRLAALPGRKVGLVWSGDPRPGQRAAHLLDRRRSIPLSLFAGWRRLPGVTLVSLQKGAAAAEAAAAAAPPLVDWTAELDDFAATAALVAGLDLVVTVDTAVAHLAGALGRPVWILSRFDGCWRWLERRADSPWYPTARLFRQGRPGDWRTVIAEVTAAISSSLRP